MQLEISVMELLGRAEALEDGPFVGFDPEMSKEHD